MLRHNNIAGTIIKRNLPCMVSFLNKCKRLFIGAEIMGKYFNYKEYFFAGDSYFILNDAHQRMK